MFSKSPRVFPYPLQDVSLCHATCSKGGRGKGFVVWLEVSTKCSVGSRKVFSVILKRVLGFLQRVRFCLTTY